VVERVKRRMEGNAAWSSVMEDEGSTGSESEAVVSFPSSTSVSSVFAISCVLKVMALMKKSEEF
jgi:hypothetical protein